MADRKLIFRVHAIRRMFERSISEQQIREVIDSGRVIESYPNDQPYPSRLMLGFPGDRPIHVVAADVPDENQTVIITVYEPDPARWTEDFNRRRE